MPDYCTSLTGWRFWKVRQKPRVGTLWLRSIVRPDLWQPGVRFEAYGESDRGLHDQNICPDAQSRSGIYAFRTLPDALEDLDRTCYRGAVLGRVSLWGIIQRHRFGYRAQFAYPRALCLAICCICKRIVGLRSEPFAIGWAAYHFSDDFSVSGFVCNVCNTKYYSLETETGYRELSELAERYGITIEEYR
ncbi:MAG: hypothetical protein ACOYVJ_03100 [Nitrospirota bacterium]